MLRAGWQAPKLYCFSMACLAGRREHSFSAAPHIGAVEEGENPLARHGLDQFFRDRCRGELPKCPDYVGPVVIQQVRGASRTVGRGLFVTKDVKEGDMLLISKAFAICECDGSGKPDEPRKADLVAQAVKKVTGSPSKLQQLYALSDGTEGGCEREVPLTSMFSNEIGQKSGAERIDVERIRRIVAVNVFNIRTPGLMESWKAQKPVRNGIGIWLLPSFINHSCAPNASWKQFGETMFVNASRDIRAGEEVRILYFDTLEPVHIRKDYCNIRGFVCCCPRCLFEDELGSTASDVNYVREAYQRWITATYVSQNVSLKSFAGARSIVDHGAVVCEQCEEFIQSNLDRLEPESRNWLRASYTKPYLGGLLSAMKCFYYGDNLSAAQRVDLVTDMVLSVDPGAEVGLQMACIPWILGISSFPHTKIRAWHHLALRFTKCYLGQLEESTKEDIVRAYIKGAVNSRVLRPD